MSHLLRPIALICLALALWIGPAAPLQAAGEPMTVSLQRLPDAYCFGPCPPWLSLSGKITPETPARLRKMLDAAPAVRLVLVSSGGGDVHAAEAIGDMIRKRRMDVLVGAGRALDCFSEPANCSGKGAEIATVAPSYCTSACVQVLASGVNRGLLRFSQVGVHRFIVLSRTVVHRVYTVRTRTFSDGRQEQTKTLKSESRTVEPVNKEEVSPASYDGARRYFTRMGIKADLLDAIQSTSNSDIRILAANELTGWNLVTAEDPVALLAGNPPAAAADRRLTATADVHDSHGVTVGRLWLEMVGGRGADEALWRALLLPLAGRIVPAPFSLVVREEKPRKTPGVTPAPIVVAESRLAGGSDGWIPIRMADVCRFDGTNLPVFELRTDADPRGAAGLTGTFFVDAVRTSDKARALCTVQR